MANAVWTEVTTVAVSPTAFPKCVSAAVEGIPGISINLGLTQPVDIVLNVKIEQLAFPLSGNVRLNDDNTVQVMIVGKGPREPDEAHVALPPLLVLLGNRIHHQCS